MVNRDIDRYFGGKERLKKTLDNLFIPESKKRKHDMTVGDGTETNSLPPPKKHKKESAITSKTPKISRPKKVSTKKSQSHKNPRHQ